MVLLVSKTVWRVISCKTILATVRCGCGTVVLMAGTNRLLYLSNLELNGQLLPANLERGKSFGNNPTIVRPLYLYRIAPSKSTERSSHSVYTLDMLRGVQLCRNKMVQSRLFSSAEDFAQAQRNLKKLVEEPDVQTKLKLYGLFKQATSGDATGNRPGVIDFAGRAKFDAWSSLKGISKEDAQQKYAELVSTLTGAQTESDSGVEGLPPTSGIEVSHEGKAFTITLNRPSKFNAITLEMYEGLIAALNHSNKCKKTSITVIRANGPYFCSGNDLSNFAKAATASKEQVKAMAEEAKDVLQRYVQAYIDHEKPLVGLVHAPAVGISVTVLALFDFVLASDKSSFQAPFSSLGQSPEGCSTYTFPQIMGHLKAAEFLVFDRKLTAEEAFDRGLVNVVIPDNEFADTAAKTVNRLSALPPESLRVNKTLIRSLHRQKLTDVNIKECNTIVERWQSKECAAAIAAFLSRGKK